MNLPPSIPMSLRHYLIVMMIATILAWTGWLLVFLYVNPVTTGIEAPLLFYGSLLLATMGTFAVGGVLVRLKSQEHAIAHRVVLLSFRQGLFFALLVVSMLILQSFRWVRWWNVLLIVVVLTILEFVGLSLRRVPGR